jgi:hypothetical protein
MGIKIEAEPGQQNGCGAWKKKDGSEAALLPGSAAILLPRPDI